MFTVQSLHVSIEIWGCIFCLIAALCIFFGRSLEAKKRMLLMHMQLGIALLLLMDAFAWGFRGYPGMVGYYMVRISNFIVFLMSDVIILLYHAYVCAHIFNQGQGEKVPKRVKLVYGIGAAGIALVIVSQFTNLYYYFDADNFYHRNTMHPLSLMVGVVCMVLDLSLLIQYHRRIKKENFLSMISYIVLPGIATVILIFIYGVSLINIAFTISAIFMFIVAMQEQSRELTQKEKELYDLKIEVMLSQIKPHFIYNTLTTIKHLCKTDPNMAADTIDEFARYLRGNLDSLTLKESISFEEELEHVKSYLAIEKKRFGERIRVVYDIETENFRLPALTLQPIVENAVKHGIAEQQDGGTIYISTTEDAEAYVIKVRDDGVGFETSTTQNESGIGHVGIRNVRNRIESMCHGKLNVYSVLGEGTIVEIRLPIKEAYR